MTETHKETAATPADNLPAGATEGTARVYLIPIDSLIPDPVGHNPQLHDEENIAMIQQSIRDLGPLAPGVCDAGTLGMFIGTGRLEAMKREGQTHVQLVIPPKNEDGTRMWTVIGVDDLDQTQQARAAFMDNLATVTGPGFDPAVYAQLQEMGTLAGVNVPPGMHESLLKQAGDLLLKANRQRDDDADPDDPSGGGKSDGDTLQRTDQAPRPGGLSEDFIMPPFSVLNAQSGRWQERKRQWLALGIQSELGRAEGVTYGDSEQITKAGLNYYRDRHAAGVQAVPDPHGSTPPAAYNEDRGTIIDGYRREEKRKGGRKKEGGEGQPASLGALRFNAGGGGLSNQMAPPPAAETDDDEGTAVQPGGNGARAYASQSSLDAITGQSNPAAGTSIFDPVLCELIYTWFSPPKAKIVDSFCGGSVRGIVAAKLSRLYFGVDLRPEQIAANIEQGQQIVPDNMPEWVTGDSREIQQLTEGGFDLFFTCPPYADLEVYSDDPRDISTLDYPAFREAYRQIIHDTCRMLHDDRFACIVVGEVRDKKTGLYHNFVRDTIGAFEDAGLHYFNELILVTAIGSLPVRAGRQFRAGRKIGKSHQNVLVFVKGDPAKAVEYCGPVQVLDLFEDGLTAEVAADDQPDAGEPTVDELRNAGVATVPEPAGAPKAPPAAPSRGTQTEYGTRLTADDITDIGGEV